MEKYTRIAHINNDVEAALLESILSERGIDHAILNRHSSAFDGLLDQADGWGVIDGPADRRDEILEILTGLRDESAAADSSIESDPS